jgi:hypothetical protein
MKITVKNIIPAMLCYAFVVNGVNAQDAPKYSNEFLAIGVGARSLGMGSAQTSAVSDVNAGYWNPAGLLHVKGDIQVGLMHSEYFSGIAKYDHVGIAKPIDSSSTLAFTFIRFGIDDIPNTIDLVDPSGNIDYDRITTFSVADQAFMLSYARKLKTPGLSLGGTAKVIYRRVGEFGQAWGFGLDAGAMYDRNKWRFAAMARDVTGTFNAWSYTLDDRTLEVFQQTNNEIPENSVEVTIPRIFLSVTREFKLNEKFDLLATADIENTFDGKRNTLLSTDAWSADPRAGIELSYSKVLYIRFGVNNIQEQQQIDGSTQLKVAPNMGVGLRIKSLSLDYALTDIGGSVALYSNVFSLKFDLYKQ